MPDLTHIFGEDLTLTPQGGLSLSSGITLTGERAIRRLLTTPGDYLREPDYGAGLLAAVGGPLNASRMQALILKNLREEATINQTAPMSVNVLQDVASGSITVTVEFSDIYGQSSSLNLPLA